MFTFPIEGEFAGLAPPVGELALERLAPQQGLRAARLAVVLGRLTPADDWC